jgi:uncharacterized protein YjbI with pentapeptide repeats
MLFESETYQGTKQVKNALVSHDAIFRYCSFESANLEGGDFDDVFLSCEFRDIDFYWGLFVLALFSNSKFERCTFRGTSFSGCRFIECNFIDCRFLKDNLNASCDSPDTKFFACIAENCEGWDKLLSAENNN